MPILHKIFRPVTRNTLISLFGLILPDVIYDIKYSIPYKLLKIIKNIYLKLQDVKKMINAFFKYLTPKSPTIILYRTIHPIVDRKPVNLNFGRQRRRR